MSTPVNKCPQVNPSEAYSEAEAYSEVNPKTKNSRKREQTVIPEWFERFKAAYPNRAGGQGWQDALKAGNARIAEGHTPEQLIEGAQRYARYCLNAQKIGTEFVKQAATFLGPGKHFLEPFTLAAKVETAMEKLRRVNGLSQPQGVVFDAEPHRPALGKVS